MDLNDYWQENKRFLLTVGAGALVFIVGLVFIESSFGAELADVRGTLGRNRGDLLAPKNPRYSAEDLKLARAEHDALVQAVDTLKGAVAFRPRERFRLQPGAGTPGNQYFGLQDEVRLELRTLAGRNRVAIPEGVDLEMLESTRAEVVVRHMEILDVIDRVLRLAVESGVRQIRSIKPRLDPAFESGRLGRIETTTVEFELLSPAGPILETLRATQTREDVAPLPIGELDVTPQRAKQDEVRVKVVFLIVRLHDQDGEEDAEE